VQVQAQWACRGRDSHDVADRILGCSNAALSGENFGQLLDRYSPGTLEHLPQVTLSWLADRTVGRNYIGIAIHLAAAGAVPGAVGGGLARTSCFCVDFADVESSAVSYTAMFEAFRHVTLPPAERGPINTAVTAAELIVPGHRLARTAAALLLTDRPVCIFGADHLDLGERLGFIDEVVSLLPFGMRSRLSASTWTSSTARSHKFRLFFSSADRHAGDHDLMWGEADSRPAGVGHVDAYLAWLDEGDLADRVTRLAAMTEPTGFAGADVSTTLRRLGLRPDRGRSRPSSSKERESRTVPVDIPTIDDLLIQCSDWLHGRHPDSVGVHIEGLRYHPGNPPTEMERAHYRTIIKERQLLREFLPIRHSLRDEFYDLLLQLGFADHLSYTDYCAIEDCVGREQSRLPHRPLAQAINRVKTTDLPVRLLVMRAIGAGAARQTLRDDPIAAEALISILADESLQPHHGRIICRLVVADLTERGHVDDAALNAALREHRYLARTLDRFYPEQPKAQIGVLSALLRLAQGKRLDDRAVQDLLVNAAARPRSQASESP